MMSQQIVSVRIIMLSIHVVREDTRGDGRNLRPRGVKQNKIKINT